MAIILKKDDYAICKYLTNAEFRCKCKNTSCKATIFSERLAEAFEDFRAIIDLPVYVTSGYRCTQHNHIVKGRPLSRHQTGEAIDVAVKNLLKHWAIERVIFIAKQCGFTYVEYYEKKGFLHLDVRGI